ncbi:hypothetical protein [Paraferrimonas sedimenticola]|uniref:Uncharacterized protein n=1 Tax=Paraferrimonas sedimenticola TaxID=375674 RepID=A0AA37RSN2_9GAMM|nr:hypothetical protein [Paraferrimonas sedimenticola]GLP95288.1 hypothetical protein GCM10007895_05940 [Paraferrimonas sedimenticola]
MRRYSNAPVRLYGGLNLAMADSDVPPGMCRQLTNIEIDPLGRYRRVLGFERFDGRSSPTTIQIGDLPDYPFPDNETALAALDAAMDAQRALIQPVPGEGPVIGAFLYQGEVFAMRNEVGGAEAKLYKATATGWQVIVTPTLNAGGQLETRLMNFKGNADAVKIYGVDGKNPAFSFDGTTFTQIAGPISPDAPITIEALPSQVLLLGYRGGSFVYSAVGEPTDFTANNGGGEIAVGDEITAMAVQPDNTCAIGCKNRTYVLYGTSDADFQLKSLSTRIGMRSGTVQTISDSVFVDDRGLTQLHRIQEFGDFDQALISQAVESLLVNKIEQITCSMVVKAKNQYRLFFDDGTALCVTFMADGQPHYFKLNYRTAFACTASGESLSGEELLFAGGNDGYLYQLDKSFSFDGTEYPSVLRTNLMDFGSPEIKKRWHKLVVELDEVIEVQLQSRLYFDEDNPDAPPQQLVFGSGALWDVAHWDQAHWASRSSARADLYPEGVGCSVAVQLAMSSKRMPPHVFSKLHLHTKVLGRRR